MKLEESYHNMYKRVLHLVAHAYTYFYITLLCMHDTATYNIVAINSTVPSKFKSHALYISARLAQLGMR